MNALILAGGFGTRLLPLTENKPKQLLPVCGKPAITYLLDKLGTLGVERIVMTVNKVFAQNFKNTLKDYNLEWVVEEQETEREKLGAVGAIWNASKKKKFDATTFIIGADNFAPELDLKGMISLHKKFTPEATIALHRIADRSQLSKFGVAVLEGNRIVGFQEKPKPGTEKSDLASTAIYVVEPRFFEKHLPRYMDEKRLKGEKPDNLGELWSSMIGWGGNVRGYVFDEFWCDIGSLEGYLGSTRAVMSGMGNSVSKSSKISKNAVLNPPVFVGADSVIGNCSIGPFVQIGKNCQLKDGAFLENSILFDSVKVGNGVRLSGCIIDEGVKIAPKKDIKSRILGDKTPQVS